MREFHTLESIIDEYPDFGEFVIGFDKSGSFTSSCLADIERVEQFCEQLGFATKRLTDNSIGIYR